MHILIVNYKSAFSLRVLTRRTARDARDAR